MPVKSAENAATKQDIVVEVDFSHHVDRKLPAADQIYQGLREAIISGNLRPNEAVSENRVCGMFNVSRSPVRSALIRLAEDGLIVIFPQRGTYVSPIRLSGLRESQFTRITLEIALVKEAALNWNGELSREIHESIASQKRHAEECDTWAFYFDNESFHRLIARAAKLPGVWNTVQSVKLLWDRVGQIANRTPGHMEKIIGEHIAIVQHLESGNADGAMQAMRLHLDSLNTTIARLKPLHAQDFVE